MPLVRFALFALKHACFFCMVLLGVFLAGLLSREKAPVQRRA
jgi:hypothetical protein